MKLFSGLINKIINKHASNFVNNVSKYDPRLKNAIINNIDNRINNIFSRVPECNLNLEMEVLEDIYFNNIGAGMFDNIFDFIKYAYYGLKCGKFKLSEFLMEYREGFARKVQTQNCSIDLRKGEISEAELQNAMKKIFTFT